MGKVDIDTLRDELEDYFGTANGISTEYAGNVWTDKTVLMNEEIAENFASITQSSAGTIPNLSVADDNFLVSLSALSSTKQITGYVREDFIKIIKAYYIPNVNAEQYNM